MARESIRGMTALVTGGAKRLGRASALALAAEGANIVIHYHTSEEEARALCREIEGMGVCAWAVGADLARSSEYEALLPHVLETVGSLSILVNNASIFPSDSLETLTFDSLVHNMEVNAWAPYMLSRAFKAQIGRGKIINMLDSRLTGYDWNHVAYIVSKHALAALTRMTALDYAPEITVNAVAPGLVLPPPGQDESYLEKLVHTVPLKRHGDDEDVAAAVAYLATTSFCTGQVLYVDGGRHLKEYVNG